MGLTTNEWYFFRVSSYDLENETDSSSVLSACDRARATWVNLSPLLRERSGINVRKPSA